MIRLLNIVDTTTTSASVAAIIDATARIRDRATVREARCRPGQKRRTNPNRHETDQISFHVHVLQSGRITRNRDG